MLRESVGSDELNLRLGRLSTERSTNHLASREVLQIQQYQFQGMRWKTTSGRVDLQFTTHQCHELKPSCSCLSFQPDPCVCFSSLTASIPTAFSLGGLARRRGGGGGGGRLICLPREKLLENGVHMVANLLRDGNNGCWWEASEQKKERSLLFDTDHHQSLWKKDLLAKNINFSNEKLC